MTSNFCLQLGCGLVIGALFRAEQGTTRPSFARFDRGTDLEGRIDPSEEPRHERIRHQFRITLC